MAITDYLELFDREGREFGILVRDETRLENEPVRNMGDINQGALHNALEYHNRFAGRTGAELRLQDARGEILKDWARFWGFANSDGLDDESFAMQIVASVLASVATDPVIQALFPDQEFRGGEQIGPYFNHSFYGVPPDPRGVSGSAFVHRTNAIYVFIATAAGYSAAIMRVLKRSRAAGIGVFVTLTETVTAGDQGARTLGPFFNHSYFGVRPTAGGVQGAAFTALDGSAYLFFADAAAFDPAVVATEQQRHGGPHVFSALETGP